MIKIFSCDPRREAAVARMEDDIDKFLHGKVVLRDYEIKWLQSSAMGQNYSEHCLTAIITYSKL